MKEIFDADETMSINGFDSQLKSLLPRASHVYTDIPELTTKTTRRKPTLSILQSLARSQSSGTSLNDVFHSISRPLAPQLGKLRAIKSKAEQQVMRAAADISGRAHAKVCTVQMKSFLYAHHLL